MPIVNMDMFGSTNQLEENCRRKSLDKKSLASEYEVEGISQRDAKKEQDIAQEGTWRRKSEDRKPEELGDRIEREGERGSTEKILQSEEREERNQGGGA